MKHQKYIQTISTDNFRTDIIESRRSPLRTIREDDGTISVANKSRVTEEKVKMNPQDLLDLAYLLIEAHHSMILNQTAIVKIETEVK